MRSFRSNTVTLCPRLFSCMAVASPEGPLPTTATVLPVRTLGGFAFISPVAKAFSIMVRSFSLVETGSPFRLQVHAFSHSAGHTLEVNSGKQCVFINLA